MSARRWAAAGTAAVLAAGPAAVAGAGSAHATEEQGGAGAVVLRTGLDVSLLNKTADVPLTVSLNEVRAPQSAYRTALTARLDGVDRGKPFSVLRAEVADARATVEGNTAESSATLVKARVHVPGLPRLGLVELEKVTSKAVCEAGRTPFASATLPGSVTVLGKRVTLTAGGPVEVEVPGVGHVRLDLSQTETTSRTAAATALRLKVSVDPLKLNVAEVEGTVTLAEATCRASAAEQAAGAPAPARQSDPSEAPAAEVEPQGGRAVQAAPAEADETAEEANLAETGGDSMTPYIAAGSVALLAAGAGAVALSRRRRG